MLHCVGSTGVNITAHDAFFKGSICEGKVQGSIPALSNILEYRTVLVPCMGSASWLADCPQWAGGAHSNEWGPLKICFSSTHGQKIGLPLNFETNQLMKEISVLKSDPQFLIRRPNSTKIVGLNQENDHYVDGD